MGVVQKKLSKAEIGKDRGSFVDFEMNENGIVHIQNKTWRIEMETQEFVEFATACVKAGNKLKELKGV